MTRHARHLALLILATLVCLVTACNKSGGAKSNNEGKIVGKWKDSVVTSAFMEFTADGKYSNYLVLASGERRDLILATYSLGPGDTVDLTYTNGPIKGKDRSRDTVTLEGDTMTYKDEYGNFGVYKRVKD